MEHGAVVDIAIVVLLAASTLVGLYRGFIREMLTLLTWIFAGAVALMYGQEVGDFLDLSKSSSVDYWIGVGVIFAFIVVIGFIIKYFVCKAFKIRGTKTYDRMAGAVFGALRGCLVVILVLVAGADSLSKQTWYKQSTMLGNFEVASNIVLDNMPAEWRTELKEDVKELEETIIEGEHDSPTNGL